MKTLIRLGRYPGWYKSSLGAHFILLVLSYAGSIMNMKIFRKCHIQHPHPIIVLTEPCHDKNCILRLRLLSYRSLQESLGVQSCSRFEPPHDKTNKMACAPREDSDQPGHPSSLVRVFSERSMAILLVLSWGSSFSLHVWTIWPFIHLLRTGFTFIKYNRACLPFTQGLIHIISFPQMQISHSLILSLQFSPTLTTSLNYLPWKFQF